jgi:DNA-binding response OmpR family regulator
LVEGDPTVRRSLIYELLDRGFEVSVTGSPSSALATLAVVQPDVIVLDTGIAEMSASRFVAAQQSRPEVRAIPVLATLAPPFADLSRCSSVSILARPFTADELATAVRALLGYDERPRVGWQSGAPTQQKDRAI